MTLLRLPLVVVVVFLAVTWQLLVIRIAYLMSAHYLTSGYTWVNSTLVSDCYAIFGRIQQKCTAGGWLLEALTV